MAQPSILPPEPAVIYPVPRWDPAWAVPEVPVPESDTHDAAIEWLRGLLLGWVQRSGRDIKVARNLGIRWTREEPRAGFDPDLCLIEPSPPKDEPLPTLRLWQPEHAAPLLAIEVVSPGHPYKDYVDTPERCAACGVGELWVYDPQLAGPVARGGPHLLQVWERTESGGFVRTAAGSDAAFSGVLRAWLHPQRSRLPAGARLQLSGDAAGRDLWLTAEQRARDEARVARSAEQRARGEAEQARSAERRARGAAEQARGAEQRARDEARVARSAEQRARDEAEQARSAEQHAREAAQQAQALLDAERQQRSGLERQLRALEERLASERRSR